MSEQAPLRSVPFRRAGNQDNLFLGGDRELVMFTGLVAFVMVVQMQDVVAAAVGLLLWFLGLYGLRTMAKADTKMRWVYLRQLRYGKFYAPRATPFRANSRLQGKRYDDPT